MRDGDEIIILGGSRSYEVKNRFSFEISQIE